MLFKFRELSTVEKVDRILALFKAQVDTVECKQKNFGLSLCHLHDSKVWFHSELFGWTSAGASCQIMMPSTIIAAQIQSHHNTNDVQRLNRDIHDKKFKILGLKMKIQFVLQ